jgi:hypothetical protein
LPYILTGEKALFDAAARSATVNTVCKTRCLRLDRNAFVLLLGPLEDILKKKVAPSRPELLTAAVRWMGMRRTRRRRQRGKERTLAFLTSSPLACWAKVEP